MDLLLPLFALGSKRKTSSSKCIGYVKSDLSDSLRQMLKRPTLFIVASQNYYAIIMCACIRYTVKHNFWYAMELLIFRAILSPCVFFIQRTLNM